MSVRKPREGSGRPRWQHRERQRIRQWSKALWSGGRTQPNVRGNTAVGKGLPAGGRALVAVTRHGCCRGKAFEGYGATGEGESRKRALASSITALAGARPYGKRHGNVFQVRTSLRAREPRQRVTRRSMGGDVHQVSQMKQAGRTGKTSGATRLQSRAPDRSVHAGPGWRASGRHSSPQGLATTEALMVKHHDDPSGAPETHSE